MVSLRDIGLSAAVNIFSAVGFLVAFAILRLQPMNDRVYFPKWYLKGMRDSPTRSAAFASKFINLDYKTYIRFLNWMPAALKMPEPELIAHAGLDSAVYIRIYLLGLKIFVPITALAFVVLVPVNWTGNTLSTLKDLQFSNIDKLSLSNVPHRSDRFWAHVVMAYVFSSWTCYCLYKEYKIVSEMRLNFLAYQQRRPDQFTVLVRNIPPDSDESVSRHVAHFFRVNHSEHYLTHQVAYNANKLAKLVEKKKGMHNRLIYYQNKYAREPTNKPTTKTGFLGLWGKPVDAIDYYVTEIEKLYKEEVAERDKVLSDPDAVLPAAFVSFRSRWAAAVCAQTQQTSKPTAWLTEWAPEPRDVYWRNLAIPYVERRIRRFLMGVALFLLIVFSMIPIAFVQSLANVDGIGKVLPFLKPLIEMKPVRSVIAGLLSGIVLKIFIILLPMILMAMSKLEGFTSLSSLERTSAGKFHLFLLINVFLGSVATGTAMQQLEKFLNQSPTEIPETVGVSIPLKASFFITYIMIDGWAGVAAEIVRLVPLILFHLNNTFLVKTEQDRMEALDPGHLNFSATEPRMQLYFLLGLVYAAITPLLLPFIIIFFAFAYLVFRHQIINVYDQKYESGAGFWPDVHRRIIIALVISQLLLTGLLGTKSATSVAPILTLLPILTICFHWFCKWRFESSFKTFPLQDAMVRDTLEHVSEPNLNLKAYLEDAYVHPIFQTVEFDKSEARARDEVEVEEEEEMCPLVPTKRNSEMISKCGSQDSGF